MIIKENQIEHIDSVSGIIKDLYNMPDFIEEIRAQNLRGGDFAEVVASEIYATVGNVNTSDFWESCR